MPIFQPYRALGYITDAVPFSVQRRGREHSVTVSVGKSWQIYGCAKLQLQFVGPQLEKHIQALASKRDLTFAAYGRHIGVFNRGHQVGTWTGHTGHVKILLVFGSHLLSIGEDHRLLLWPLGTPNVEKPDKEIQLSQDFTATTVIHPDTYLNKILIGSEEGRLQLWNIATQSLVYEFPGFGSPIRSCECSPALDVVGVGLADGRVVLHNLKFDEIVMTLKQASAVTSISFRRDNIPLLAAGSPQGIITIFNLEKQKLHTVIKDAHDGSIVSLYFFPSEPILMSSGSDNALKMWIFDTDDNEARLLRFRSGHAAPPSCIEYYGEGRHILSAGQDRAFRVFSVIQDQQSRELSQGHVAKRAKKLKLKEEELKLPQVTSFAASSIRERDWVNIVTCHLNSPQAYTWRLQNFVIGQHILQPPGGNPSAIRSVAISVCGNFAVLGADSGRIDRFNLQSGMYRGSYGTGKGQFPVGHEGAVVGVAVDGGNQNLISGGYDGTIKVWDFRKRQLISVLELGCPITKLIFHRGNNLVAVAGDDLIIRLYDAQAARLVRRFPGHKDRVTDLCFSEDGRWLVSSAMDCSVRVWDVVGARLLDAMKLDHAVTALSLSPGMDMLATCHAGRRGIYLWANRLLYEGTTAEEIKGSSRLRHVSMPKIAAEDGGEESEEEGLHGGERVTDTPSTTQKGVDKVATPGKQLMPHLVTLALLPKSQWMGLVNLDTIKARNKPIAPPKKPETAPFFLPSLPSLSGNPAFVPPQENQDGGAETKAASRVRKHSGREDFRSEFMRRLHEGAEKKDYSELLEHLRNMSPSAIDAEVRALEVIVSEEEVDPEEVVELGMVMDFVAHELGTNCNFELLQAFLNLFLKVHGEAIAAYEELQAKARVLLERQIATWPRLDHKFQHVRCMVGYLSNIQ